MIHVVGAGFAGVEAAWQVAQHGLPVRLYEMRPERMTPAHTTGHMAELVCSNSFKSKSPTSPAGLLKHEMAALGSIVLEIAFLHEVPGGEALAVDRDSFAQAVTEAVSAHAMVSVECRHVGPDDIEVWLQSGDTVVLATGPLTSDEVSAWLAQATGRGHLYFYDAVSPTVDAATIDREVVFAQSRYDKGGDDYLNCPFDRDSYERFVEELVAAERAPIHAFEAGGRRDLPVDGSAEERFVEKVAYFAGCMPIEIIAERGARSLAFGNFKPVGLTDPRTGRRPHAALQLRPENREGTLYSLVGCQTRLKWGEQKRVFRIVPGLERAEFVRYGVIHRNTYVDAPSVLAPDLQVLGRPGLYLAGQLCGVEGYVESAAMGQLVGLYAARAALARPIAPPPRETALGSLLSHLQDPTPRSFAPMNINWGLLPRPAEESKDKGLMRQQIIANAHEALNKWRSGE